MADELASNRYRVIVWRKAYDRTSSVISRDILHMEEGYMSALKLGNTIRECVDTYRPKVSALEDLDIQVVTLHHRSRKWDSKRD